MVRAVRECVEILNQAIVGKPGGYQGELYKIGWFDVSWAAQTGADDLRRRERAADAEGGLGLCVGDHEQRFHAGADSLGPRHHRPGLTERGLDPARFPYNNFWAWHVQESREEAYREACIYLAVRGTIYPDYIGDVVDEDDAAVVTARTRVLS